MLIEPLLFPGVFHLSDLCGASRWMGNRTSVLLSWKLRHMELVTLHTVTLPTVSKTRCQAQVYPAFVQSSCSSASSPPLFPYSLIIGNKGLEPEIQEKGLGHAQFHPGRIV